MPRRSGSHYLTQCRNHESWWQGDDILEWHYKSLLNFAFGWWIILRFLVFENSTLTSSQEGICWNMAKNPRPMIGGRPVTLEDHSSMHKTFPRRIICFALMSRVSLQLKNTVWFYLLQYSVLVLVPYILVLIVTLSAILLGRCIRAINSSTQNSKSQDPWPVGPFCRSRWVQILPRGQACASPPFTADGSCGCSVPCYVYGVHRTTMDGWWAWWRVR